MDISEPHTLTGSEHFSLLISLDAIKFVLLSAFTPIEFKIPTKEC